MPFTEPDELPRRHSREELLARIYRDGERLRRRRLIGGLGAGTALVAVIAAAVLVARLPGGEPQQVATRGLVTTTAPGSPPTTDAAVVEAPPTTVAAGQVVATTAPPTTRTPATTRPPVTSTAGPPAAVVPETSTTTAGETCRDSTDSACGAFRWDPEPGPNAPLTIEVTSLARPGDPRTVDFHVDYSDPDAKVDEGCRTVSWGDDTTESVSGGPASCVQVACAARYGPTTPPAPEPGHAEATVAHTFANPGTYEIRFTARSGFGCYQPYANWTDKTVVVVIQ